MERARLAVISLVHFALAPGVVVGLIPWAISGWDQHTPPWSSPAVQTFGAALIAGGVAVLVRLFARFVTDGLGTPAPIAPTRHLVVSGLYRHVRNPMYIAVVAAIAGQAFLLGRADLLVYAATVWVIVAAFVRWYEEPALQARFTASYDEYRDAVPAWWPRLHPWHPDAPLRTSSRAAVRDLTERS